MLNLNSFLLFSENPQKLVDFYKKVFKKGTDWSGGDFQGFTVGDGSIAIGPHDKVHGKNKNPERMIINLEVGEKSFQKEVERITKVSGAKLIQKPYHPGEEKSIWVATFADPDGNYFQLMTPFKMG